ncbi:MAG: alkaline phosphatase D family protein, partial [Solirubrobacteraceae bacterium]
REHLLGHIKQTGISDVVFISGDVHTFVAGDVCANMGSGPPVAPEFACGSITSPTVAEVNFRMPGRVRIPGNDVQPFTPPQVMAHYRALNPWFDQLDLERHGYGIAAASRSTFNVEFKRLWTIKQRNYGTLPPDGFRWQVKRGQASIRGTAF